MVRLSEKNFGELIGSGLKNGDGSVQDQKDSNGDFVEVAGIN
jgi:hypothetical protein